MTIRLPLLILCSTLIYCHAVAKPQAPRLFNVLDFGANPGKPKESTLAFMRTWEATCNHQGNARMVVPVGTYRIRQLIFQGPCKSLTPVVILLHGTVQAVSHKSAFSDEQGWIQFEEIDGLVLTGGGTIDGQGQNMWQYNDCKTNPSCTLLPATVYMIKVRNVRIKSITILNSIGFNMHITQCNLVMLHNITIDAPDESPNTDGLHISKSNAVKFSNSVIKTGDDCISIGQGSTNITINQLTCGPGHGISVGSLGRVANEMDVRGLIVRNSTLIGTTNGLRIKTFPDSSPSEASGMLFKDITMENVKNPIVIDQNYGSSSTKPSLVKIKDIIFENIRGTTVSPVAINLQCSASVPCQNVRFHDINLQHVGNERVTSMCSNVRVDYIGKQNPPPCWV